MPQKYFYYFEWKITYFLCIENGSITQGGGEKEFDSCGSCVVSMKWIPVLEFFLLKRHRFSLNRIISIKIDKMTSYTDKNRLL